jgi:ketosteroid isomerase-like protein
MSQENVEAVRRCLDAWNRGDFDAFVQDWHPESEFFSAFMVQAEGDVRPFRGPQAMRRYWDEWHSLWDLSVEVSETRDLEDTVVVVAGLKVRGKGSGVEIESALAYVFEFDNDLFRKVHTYLNLTDALEAVGLEE